MRAVLLILFLDVLAYSMIAPLLPFYVRDIAGDGAATAWLSGMLGAGYAAMQLISGPILGALSDRRGRRPILLACQAGTIISFAMLANATTIELLFAAVLIDGLTGGNLTTAYAYIADISTSANRTRHLALAGAAFGLGVTVGPALGSLLTTAGAPVPVAACLAATASFVAAAGFLPESQPSTQPAPRMAGTPRYDPVTIRLLAAIFAANLSFAGLQANFGIFSADRFSWTPSETSGFFAFIGCCAVIAQGLLLPAVQRRFGDRALITGGLPLLALGLAGIALADDARWLFPAAAAAALGSGFALPTLSAAAAHTAAEQRGLLMGATQSLLAVANITAPLMTGAAYAFVAPGAPYFAGCACALLASVAAHLAFVKLRTKR